MKEIYVILTISIILNIGFLINLYFSQKKDVNYESTAEKVYFLSYWLMSCLVIGTMTVTALMKYLNPEIKELTLIPTEVLSFAETNIFWFIIPIIIKLVGDESKLNAIKDIVLAIRGIQPQKKD